MFANLLIAAALQVGPFYEQRPADAFRSVRPFWSCENGETDVLWPVYAQHGDWWRFCLLVHEQDYRGDGYQFEIMPVWFNGRTEQGETYAGLFPIYGHHPHLLFMYDIDFCLWPVWTRYRMPRPSQKRWLTSNAVLFPFVSWRDDGAWGLWPFYGVNYQRESDHRYALWPIVTWASYRADRDTAGAGSSWMVWPIWGSIDREREHQEMFVPPFFSWTSLADGGWRLRSPYPFIEVERSRERNREVLFPLYEHFSTKTYRDAAPIDETYRFGWRFIEILPGETRVFPVWKRNRDHLRVWPFYEARRDGDTVSRSVLALFPITWAHSIDRNWARFWTFYTAQTDLFGTDHSLLWGLVRWRTEEDEE